MFTGLIEEVGEIRGARAERGGKLLTLGASVVCEGLKVGDSVAVDGACLTVETLGQGEFSVFLSQETLDCTTLGEAGTGRRVNLERALALGDRLGGHLVQGHVDAVGRIVGVQRAGEGLQIEILAPKQVARYLVDKGSVTVDGISLTVARRAGERFFVAVIPHTVAATTLDQARPGRPVNLEADLLAKYVERLLGGQAGSDVDLELLARQGFIR